VTILTDFADLPPHFWIEPDQAQHFICGTAKAVAQAHAMGYGTSRVHAVSGMIVRPDFYRERRLDRRAEIARLAWIPTGPPVSCCSAARRHDMQGIARRLSDTQLILICGHNTALAERIAAMRARAPAGAGSRRNQRIHALERFLIGKPGPGCISEAMQQGLPVIVVKNRWTMPQERYNADWSGESRRHRARFLQLHPGRRPGDDRPAAGIPLERRAHPQPRRLRDPRHPRAHSRR